MPVTADEAYPFDAGAGADVAESQWRSMARHWRPSGPLITDLAPADWDVLKPSAGAGLQVLVESGSAWIRGHYAQWDAQEALTIGANSSGSTRVDAIVARLDATDNLVELDVVAGTPGAGLPALTQNSSTWEILLGSSTLLNGGSSVTVADLRKCVGYSNTTYTPTIRYGSTTATVTGMTARVVRRDDLVRVVAEWTNSNLNGGTGELSMSLPTNGRGAVSIEPVGNAFGAAMGVVKPAAVFIGSTTPDRVLAYKNSESGGPSITWDNSDVGSGWTLRFGIDYEAAN
jgi:hypothetical protein